MQGHYAGDKEKSLSYEHIGILVVELQVRIGKLEGRERESGERLAALEAMQNGPLTEVVKGIAERVERMSKNMARAEMVEGLTKDMARFSHRQWGIVILLLGVLAAGVYTRRGSSRDPDFGRLIQKLEGTAIPPHVHVPPVHVPEDHIHTEN